MKIKRRVRRQYLPDYLSMSHSCKEGFCMHSFHVKHIFYIYSSLYTVAITYPWLGLLQIQLPGFQLTTNITIQIQQHILNCVLICHVMNANIPLHPTL